jgi:hypothetical protein
MVKIDRYRRWFHIEHFTDDASRDSAFGDYAKSDKPEGRHGRAAASKGRYRWELTLRSMVATPGW